LDVANWLKPPYRCTASYRLSAALVGGGSNPDRAKYHSHITVLYFSMSCLNLIVKYWKSYASRWKQGTSLFHAPPGKLIFPPDFS